MSDDDNAYRVITLSNRAPVRIVHADWPVIARGDFSHFVGETADEASRSWRTRIRVRQHADGRTIAYGVYNYQTQFQREQDQTCQAGLLVTDEDLVAAIQTVVGLLTARITDREEHPNVEAAGDAAIADLPPEDLT
jgi:hypothetical protein